MDQRELEILSLVFMIICGQMCLLIQISYNSKTLIIENYAKSITLYHS